MDTTDTTTATDLVIIDAELVDDDADSAENTVGKTLATAGATSALVIGVVLAYKHLAPKVAAYFSKSSKDEEPEAEEIVEITTETPETEKV